MIEAKKIAYADMIRYTADPKFAKIPVEGLRSKAFGATRAKLINASKAACDVGPGVPPETDKGTTYLSVVDKDGNMVSLIQSNYSSVGFGSGLRSRRRVRAPERGGLFTLDKSHPNSLVGAQAPVSQHHPAFMERGDTKIAFGIMGGWNQGQAARQFVSNIVGLRQEPQGAAGRARFSKETFAVCDVNFEARIPEKDTT